MKNRSDWGIWPWHARMFNRLETKMCLCWTLYRHRSFLKFFFSFAFISFLTLLLLILAALALGESCNHQKCLNHRSAIRPLGMKPDREQWNIVTWCNLGICSVLYDNCVWLKMSVMTDVVCYRLCFMILKNGILLRVQGWDVLRGREWDLQMTRSRVLSVKFRFMSPC